MLNVAYGVHGKIDYAQNPVMKAINIEQGCGYVQSQIVKQLMTSPFHARITRVFVSTCI